MHHRLGGLPVYYLTGLVRKRSTPPSLCKGPIDHLLPWLCMPKDAPQMALSHGGSGCPPNVQFLGPARLHISNSISIRSSILARLMPDITYTFQWAGRYSPKIASFCRGDLGCHLIHGFLDSPQSMPQAASWWVELFFRAHICNDQSEQTDTHTDHATYVAIGHI